MNQTATPPIQCRKVDYLLLILLSVAIYVRTLGHEFQMSWDDNWYIVYNESIQGFSWQNIKTIFSSIYQANYAPLQMLSYMLDYSLWGLDPAGFVLTNVIFHTLNGLLLYRLLNTLHDSRLLALVAAAFFLVHPLQVESVAWISCRKNVLSLFFFLLSWEAYRYYRQADIGRGRGAYVASLIAFLLSLMAKSTTLILPLVLVLYDYCFPEGGRRLRLKDKIPFVVATLVFAVVSMYFQHTDFQGGIRAAYHGGSPLGTFYTMLPVFSLYLWRLVWPTGLSAIYDPPVYSAPDGAVLACGLLLAAVIWGGVRLFRYDRSLGFWFLFFWIGLLPFAQIVPILWLITDRYMNVSIIGTAVLAGAAAVWLRNRLGTSSARVLYLLLIFWIGALSMLSFQRVGIWRDSLTLWSDVVTKTATSARAWGHYGEVLMAAGQLEASLKAYERGLNLDSANIVVLDGLGRLYNVTEQLDKGLFVLSKLLKQRPDYVTGWASLGTNYMKRGNYNEAEKAYNHAQSLQPDAWQLNMLQGDLALVQGDFARARDFYGLVETKGYDNPQNAYQLACVESLTGQRETALFWLEKALQRGYRDYEMIRGDERLSALWQESGFNHLLIRYNLLQ